LGAGVLQAQQCRDGTGGPANACHALQVRLLNVEARLKPVIVRQRKSVPEVVFSPRKGGVVWVQ
jgi:hypothetical protein